MLQWLIAGGVPVTQARLFAEEVGKKQMEAMNLQMDYARKDRERYDQIVVPMQDKYIAEAMGVDTNGMDQAAYRKAAVDAVRQLSVDVGIPTKLEALKEEDLDFLAESAYADACRPGNPKDTCVEDLKDLFRKLM